MRNQARKAVVNWKTAEKKVNLAGVHKAQVNKSHKHACSNPSCRLVYEDSCFTPELNGRCRPCKGMRRTWLYPDGTTSKDPVACCRDNTELLTDPADLLRFECAGPGPWFQCLTCKRTHAHNCTDPDLLARPLAVHQEGTS